MVEHIDRGLVHVAIQAHKGKFADVAGERRHGLVEEALGEDDVVVHHAQLLEGAGHGLG